MLRATSLAAGGVWAVTFLCWMTGRLVSDRYAWSQFVAWVPSWAMVAVGVACMAWVSLCCAVMTRRRAAEPAQRLARRLGYAVLLVVTLHLAFIDLRLGNVFGRARPETDAAVSVLTWNLGATGTCGENWSGWLTRQSWDVAILTTPWPTREAVSSVPADAPPSGVLMRGRFFIASRFPIRRWGQTSLRIPPGPNPAPHPITGRPSLDDPGQAMFVELDASARLGRSIVVWIIDMPSDLMLPRWKIAGQARSAIDSFPGPVFEWDGAQWSAPNPHTAGFPAPDLIVGDFNIPRGSASLRRIVGNATNAFDESGLGYAASFPRSRPLVHIDQSFVNGPCKALKYDILVPPEGTHRAQLVVVGR
jgi:hypothetical protein